MRRARIDANQIEVVRALRAIGASVQSLASVGKGVPDLLVGYHGINVLLEVKDGRKPPSETRLTPAEKQWAREWVGQWNALYFADQAVALVERLCVKR
jgi:hypothetical protein